MELGCDLAQGFYMAAPMAADELEKWLKESIWGLPTGNGANGKDERLARTV